MRKDVLTGKEIGKYIFIRITEDKSFPVKIISVSGGCCGWMVLDPDIPLRSGKCRINEKAVVKIYDTAEEILEQTVKLPIYGMCIEKTGNETK